jgi:hypothetical protein
MTDPMDFPLNPTAGQLYTAPGGMVYVWDGYAWTVSYYDSATQQLQQVGDVIGQVRILLQDTDNTASSGYRYSSDSIVVALNQGMLDMFRIRPDLFLENGFVVPKFDVGTLGALIGVEEQYIPPLVYYVTGLVQARDDEQNQDSRAMAFMKTFSAALLTVA